MKKKLIILIIIILILLIGIISFIYIKKENQTKKINNQILQVKTDIKSNNLNQANNELNILTQEGALSHSQSATFKEEIQSIKNKELQEAKDKKITIINNEFNKKIASAIKLLNNNLQLNQFENSIDSIDTNDLSKENLNKLNSIKSSFPEISKYIEVQNYLNKNNYTEAAEILNSLNTNLLVTNNIITTENLNSLSNEINKNLNKFNPVKLIKDLNNYLTEYNAVALALPQSKMNLLQISNGQPTATEPEINFINNLANQYGSDSTYIITKGPSKNNSFTLNGETVYPIELTSIEQFVAKTTVSYIVMISASGHVYNYSDLESSSNALSINQIIGTNKYLLPISNPPIPLSQFSGTISLEGQPN